MKTQNEETYKEILEDIGKLYPRRVTLNKQEVASLTGLSQSTLDRQIRDGEGIEYKKIGVRVLYPVRKVAEFLSETVKTV